MEVGGEGQEGVERGMGRGESGEGREGDHRISTPGSDEEEEEDGDEVLNDDGSECVTVDLSGSNDDVSNRRRTRSSPRPRPRRHAARRCMVPVTREYEA